MKRQFRKNVIKVFVLTFMGISLLDAAPPQRSVSDYMSGFLVGLELGTSATFQKTTTTENATATKSSVDNFPNGNVGLKLGYAHFFNSWVGLRGYASYHYGFLYDNSDDGTTKSSNLSSYHQVAGNIEATFKFFDFNGAGLGAYAGIGLGYGTADTTATSTESNTTTTTNTKIASGFILPVNVGLEVYIGENHNTSLNFRIPTIATKLTTTDTAGVKTKNELRNLIITLGYTYTF